MTKGPHGWIILNKPPGLGSTQAVSAVKRNLRDAGLLGKLRDGPKVGHGGTLDPLAEGVLPIALGEATKLTGRLLEADKIYDFTIRFGEETDTLDAEGSITRDEGPMGLKIDDSDVEDVLGQFIGEIEQIPPAYSAIKVDGVRAYTRARSGQAVELGSRSVTIYDLQFRSACWDTDAGKLMVSLTAHVSKGTYIRSLARDIAHACGTVGHVTMLRRTKAGPFALSQSISLDKLNQIGQGAPIEGILLPLEAGLADIPVFRLTPDEVVQVRQGRVLTRESLTDGLYWARSVDDTPIALMQVTGGNARVERGFNIQNDVAKDKK